MKKKYSFIATALLFFNVNLGFSQVTLASDDFTYPDGALAGNGNWTSQGGTAGTLVVAGGEAVITQNSGSEDTELIFDNDLTNGILTATFDIKVTAPAAMTGTDFEYFAHFSNDSEFNFRSRLDVIAPNDASGDYSLGLSALTSTNDAALSVDFSFAASVTVILTYNLNTGEATLTAGGETITSAGQTGDTLDSFNFRQSNSSSDETIFVDNLVISYDNTLSSSSLETDKFNLFPNPTNTGEVTVASVNASPISVDIFDVLGKRVKNETISNNRLDVSNLKPGVYLLRLTQDNATSTKKLVIR